MAFVLLWLAGLMAGPSCSEDNCRSATTPIEVSLEISGIDETERNFELDFPATVESTGNGVLSLSTEAGLVQITYSIGAYELPVGAGDAVEVIWRQVQPFGVARGLSLWTSEGRLLALIDDGRFGSAWLGRPAPQTVLGGFNISTESVGCDAFRTECFESSLLGLRFSHTTGTEVLVEPGKSAILTGESGQKYEAVNAFVERISEVRCTDTTARLAWFVLAKTE